MKRFVLFPLAIFVAIAPVATFAQDNAVLNRYAQAWANELAKRGRVEHRKRSKYGENIFEGRFGKDGRMKGRRAVNHWYDEIEDYDFGKGGRQRGTEGFTQVVWRNSSLLGTVAARGRGNKYYIVSVYDLKGNVRGQYRSNVNKPAEEGDNEKTNSKADKKPEPAPRPPRLQVAPPAHVPQSKPGPIPRPQQNPSTPIRF